MVYESKLTQQVDPEMEEMRYAALNETIRQLIVQLNQRNLEIEIMAGEMTKLQNEILELKGGESDAE